MQIALLMNLAPRKLGSFEAWVIELCRTARTRGHRIDVFGRRPRHPKFADALQELGSGWGDVGELEAAPLSAARRLARYDVLHLNLFAPRSRVALIAYAAVPARVLYVDHSYQRTGTHRPPGRLLSRALDRVTMVRVNSLAGVSNYVRDRTRQRFSFPESRARTIYNGVDVSRFSPRRPPSKPAGRPLEIAAVAWLIPEKGVDDLVRALACMRSHARLVVAGDGPEAPRLAALAGTLGLTDRIDLMGLRDDVDALLGTADVFVHAAKWGEGFGLAIAEAMAAGLPVVATRVGGIPELIVHGESGLLVEPRDPEALANALDELARDPDKRARLGTNARRRVVEHFDLARCVEAHVQFCEEAAGQPVWRATPAHAGRNSTGSGTSFIGGTN